jgi:hypothetical protein
MRRGRRGAVDAELAELGAAVKFAELKKQMDDLIRRFPSLKGRGMRGERFDKCEKLSGSGSVE